MNDTNNYESVHRKTNQPITIYHWNNHLSIHNHWHEHIEILYFVKGHAYVQCGQKKYDVYENDIIIINSNELHKCDYMDTGTEYYCFVLSPHFFYIADFPDYVFKNHVSCNEYMRSCFERVIKEYIKHDIGYESIIKGELYNILVFLLRNHSYIDSSSTNYNQKINNLNKVNTVIQYINNNYEQDISIEYLSSLIYCSKSYLQHLFKEETGQNITEYINNTRITASMRLLKSTDAQVREIADQTGFQDYNYYSRVFKKKTGITPLEYRKQSRKTAEKNKKNTYLTAHNDKLLFDKFYDLTLPEWGPYNKEYSGFSHIADKEKGIRFDIDIFPGFFRRSVLSTSAINDSGAKAWQSTPDFSHIVYRFELEWKDNVYIDVHMLQKNNNAEFILKYNNNTDIPQSLQTSFVMSLRYPTYYHIPLNRYTVVKNDNIKMINAVNYYDAHISDTFPQDGLFRGEGRFFDFTDNNGISSEFFCNYKDFLTYSFSEIEAQSIGIRYKCTDNAPVTFIINDGELPPEEPTLPKSDTPKLYTFNIAKTKISKLTLINQGIGISIDAIFLGDNLSNIYFQKESNDNNPVITTKDNSLSVKYPTLNHEYNITCDADEFVIRSFQCDNIAEALTKNIHNHVTTDFNMNGENRFTDLFIRPVFLKPHEQKTVKIHISAGNTKNEIYPVKCFAFTPNKAGDKYLFSQNLMAAVTMTNVVFPIYCRGKYIKHNAPGRNWDSLYTWDSGFVGLGLSTIDRQRAIECLNTYLTPPGDIHSPFILHGSPVPTQVFLYQQLINTSDDTELLKEYYPSMKQYYSYFSDLKHTPNQHKTGLLNTWHLFYNSGGWDDYPAQVYIHDNHMEKITTPVITTAVTVLFAKIMRLAALLIGEDTKLYDDDIAYYENALSLAWDNKSGYYSYVIHNSNGVKNSFLTTHENVNYNMGFDGIYPYISYSADNEKNNIMYHNIKYHMMTDCGVSVVAANAPYYSKSGYWNGSVWMPHQWILWKSLLDHGEYEFA